MGRGWASGLLGVGRIRRGGEKVDSMSKAGCVGTDRLKLEGRRRGLQSEEYISLSTDMYLDLCE